MFLCLPRRFRLNTSSVIKKGLLAVSSKVKAINQKLLHSKIIPGADYFFIYIGKQDRGANYNQVKNRLNLAEAVVEPKIPQGRRDEILIWGGK